MLITKTDPVGIDWHVQELQTKIHNQLVTDWALADATKYQAYGRCYRNKIDAGYIAEVLTTGKEYKEVFWNDELTALSFFGLSGQIKHGLKHEADVHFVMFANLAKLFPGAAHRMDEELRKQVFDLIGRFLMGFTVTGIELWLENVLKEYPGSRRENRLKYVDMHPVHCFRINMKIFYNPNKIC
jgi:hypothetical protein